MSVLNRGATPDALPPDVERIRASRTDAPSMTAATRNRHWDVVVDTTSYTGDDAANVMQCFRDRCSRILAVSTGQVYLVRQNVESPFRESEYEGDLVQRPEQGSDDYRQWMYGVQKRDMEAVFSRSARPDFPVVTLRMPMIASERDHYGRIQGYIARVLDGGPILVPRRESLPIRHVYVRDAADAIVRLCTDERAGAQSYNISCCHSISLEEFFVLLGNALERDVEVRTVDTRELEARNLLPACSPYSTTWMSELDSAVSLAVLGSQFSYAGPEQYLGPIVEDYLDRWVPVGLSPPGYERRVNELELEKSGGK